MLTKETVYLLAKTDTDGMNISEIESISTFGFLYGALPTAPTVVLYATQYNLEVDMVSKATFY